MVYFIIRQQQKGLFLAYFIFFNQIFKKKVHKQTALNKRYTQIALFGQFVYLERYVQCLANVYDNLYKGNDKIYLTRCLSFSAY